MIKAIIIEDEPYCAEVLSDMLALGYPDIEICAVCKNGEEGLKAILKKSPDLVFLDVEMPKMNGFEMLEQLTTINFHLVFTTSYDQYALKAIRFSAIDYLLKPIDREELKKAIDKVRERIFAPLPQQLEILMQRLKQPSVPMNRVALPTMEGLQLIQIDSIIHCESLDNYTTAWLKGGKKILITRSLKDMEEVLEQHSFLRVHRYYIVNLNEIEKYIKGEGGYLIMSDKKSIDVARNKKEVLLKKLLPTKM